MIKLIRSGDYQLIETKNDTKILQLDKDTYAWIKAENIGHILVDTYRPFKTDYTLAVGKYRLYDVKEEPDFTDQIHLELFIGGGRWQGYLLLTGLPTDKKTRVRLIPTKEIISAPNKTDRAGRPIRSGVPADQG